jgi:hypothetical protein
LEKLKGLDPLEGIGVDGSIMLDVIFYGWPYIPENCNVERNNAESSTYVEDRTVY